MILLVIQFLVIASVIVLTGSQLCRYADVIAEKTGLGRTWVGVFLVATITSLPELATGISAVAIHEVPDIAAGDAIGSCMFNLLILVVLDALDRSRPLSARAHQGQVLTAAFGVVLLSLAVAAILGREHVPVLAHVSLVSWVIVVVYLVAMCSVFSYEQKRVKEFVKEMVLGARYQKMNLRRAVVMYVINGSLVVAAGGYLPLLGRDLAQASGLGQTFVGAIFVALATSLPELVVATTALKIGAIDMLFGNVFGSNMFNILILAIDDLFYLPGSLFAAVSTSHTIAASTAIAMTAFAIIGLTYRMAGKRLPVAWDALGMFLAFVMGVTLIYQLR